MKERTEIVTTPEFDAWWASLPPRQADRVARVIEQLERRGPTLDRPHADRIKGSTSHNMKELRTGSFRVLFVFDRQRRAVLLLGGDKRSQGNRWYPAAIRKADKGLVQYRHNSERRRRRVSAADYDAAQIVDPATGEEEIEDLARLARSVAALGGRLEVNAVFPEKIIRLLTGPEI